MVQLVALLWRNAKGLFTASVVVGVISGCANVALLSMIHLSAAQHQVTLGLIVEFCFVAILTALTRFGTQSLAVSLAHNSMYDLVMSLSREILRTPLDDLETIGIPRLLATLTDDVTSLTAGLIAIANIGLSAALVGACFLYLGLLSPILLFYMVITTGATALTYVICVRLAEGDLRSARECQDRLYVSFRALTEGAKELRIYQSRADALLNDDMRTAARLFQRFNFRGRAIYGIAGTVFQILYFGAIGVLIFIFPKHHLLDQTALLASLLVLLFIMAPIGVLMTSAPTIAQASISFDKLARLGLSLHPTPSTVGKRITTELPHCDENTVDLENVCYRYRENFQSDSFQLGPISLTASPGEVLFLVGGNGSGKTTLAKLITGLYSPESGRILLNGIEVSETTRAAYRQLFAALFTDSYLFEKVVALEGVDLPQQVVNHLKAFQLDEKVRLENHAWSTISLSQGQRKRLSLIDALLSNRPILVLDEWAAEQDPVFREIFYLELLPQLVQRRKTVIVISHDDRYFHLADKLICLERGQVLRQESAVKKVSVVSPPL